MTPPPTAGRIVCPQCGANNFATQSACWKCGAVLARGSTSVPNVPASPLPNLPTAPQAEDPQLAFWSSLALGLLFPLYAVPVGIVFLMLDDRRRSEIGRFAIIFGIIGTVLHLIVTAALLRGTIAQVRALLPLSGAARNQPGLNDPVEPLQLPGLSR